MCFIKHFSAVITIFAFLLVSFPVALQAQQETQSALSRGYHTGYSDGYLSGYHDSTRRSRREFEKQPDYVKANRVYRSEYGAIEDYRDGYQQGYESGYSTAYERREFDSALPANLSKRTETSAPSVNKEDKNEIASPNSNASENLKEQTTKTLPVRYQAQISNDTVVIIPTDTEIIVEMLASVSTEDSKQGDKFLAKVVAPDEIKNAIIEGRVERLKKPGRVKGNGELELSFDRIVINETRWSNFNATVIEALPMPGNNIKSIDNEGTVEGKSSVKSDAVKVGVATGTGAAVGALAGGPVGAAVGAAVGGAIGIGGVLIMRGKHINLDEGQQLRLRTNYETQIR